MKQKIKYYVIILILIAGIISVGSFNDSSNTEGTSEEFTYSNYWREPNGTELRSIGKIMVQNGVSGCGEYYLKLVGLKEYIVACTSNSKNWDYYIVNIDKNKISKADKVTISKLTAPYQ